MSPKSLLQRAREVIPGGVNSPVRAFHGVGGDPFFVASGEGAEIIDIDGNRYIDYVLSYGPLILGHAHPAVVEAVQKVTADGLSFGAPTRREVELAERICDRVPGVEKVRLVNSGTEATMSAIRLARGATGRAPIIKFTGCYHGHADSFLIEAGSGAATLGVPSSPGVTEATARDTWTADFNDLDSVEAAIEKGKPARPAAIILEPVAGNMGTIPPAPGFLEGLREICDRTGALLIFDEVMTGFRVAPGGAQQRYDVLPDITTLGKVVGGGMPIGAYGGTREIMKHVAPDGPVYQAGTLSGNPLSTAAGLATLELLAAEPDTYDRLEALGHRLEKGIREAADAVDLPTTWNRVGSMASLTFAEGPVTDWNSAASQNREAYGRFFWAMKERGVFLPPSGFETFFLSLAHTEADIDRTIEAAAESLKLVAEGE